MLPRQDQPALGVGESASVPSAAAIANAIYDATGVRFRELPFTPERILAGLRGEQSAAPAALPSPAPAPSVASDKWQNPFAATARRVGDASRRYAPRWSASLRPCCHGDRSRRSRGRIRRSIRPQPSPAASNSPHSATARSATPPQTASSMPAAGHSRRRSARSTAPTSRPMSRPGSAPGPIPPSSARCARASIATASISIRHFPIRISPRPPMPTCRRSTPI